MRIDSIQSNIAMRPLGNFLFKCEFSNTLGDTIVSKDVLNEKLMQKLKYSVLSLNIPRMESQQADNLNYGSFFITFPFFSTEKKEMTMRFYETDQMEIFKIFTYLLSKTRWKASTMFRWEQADLYVTVTIYDQRNLYGYGYRALFSETYALKTIKVEPPEFSRTSDVTLLETTIKFNTCQNRNYDRGAISSIDAAGDFAKNDSAADNAFISAEEMGDRIAKQFEAFYQKEMEDMYKVDLDGLLYQQTVPDLAKLRASKGTKGGDFILDQNELDELYKIHKQHEGKNAMTKEDFAKMNQENLNRLAKGFVDMNKNLKGTGFDITVNTVNDTNHKYSSTTASHETSSKMDLTILKDGKKVTVGDLSESEAQKLKDAADAAGLVLNFEKTKGDSNSLWVDAHPKVISTPTGEKTVENSWTGMWRNVHVEGDPKYDVDLVTGEEIERGAYKRTAQQKKNQETAEAKKDLKREIDTMNQRTQESMTATSTKRPQRISTLPPDNLKELKENPRGSFNSTEALLK